MCLAVPEKVVAINGQIGSAEVGGIIREVNLMMISDVQMGDFVLVHTGFAIEKIDPTEAAKTLALFREMMSADEIC